MRCEICKNKKGDALPDGRIYCLKCVRCKVCGSNEKKNWWWNKNDWFYCRKKCYFEDKNIPHYKKHC